MLIAGLGNPGLEYRKTYHNVGFMAVDLLAQNLGFKWKDKLCRAKSASFYENGAKIVVAKPETYMNLSGVSVRDLLSYHKMQPKDAVIVYDDVDLPVGELRIRKSGSAGTHNGMRNIVECLNTIEIPRIRIGIGKPEGQMELRDYVLSKIKGENAEKIEAAVEKACACLQEWIKTQDIESVMRRYNG